MSGTPLSNIAIITCYVGRLPNYFDVWLKSCEHNPDVDFMVVTDQHIKPRQRNVRVVNMDLPTIKRLADEKLSLNTTLYKPYKLCDFKTVYGIVFEDYLKSYSHWGCCDIDLVFGNIRSIITDDVLKAYDRILFLGHLCIYRNTKEVNERYKLDGASPDYVESFTATTAYCNFDEWRGMYRIYKMHGFPMYEEEIAADIPFMYKRVRIARRDNYKHQLLYWHNGEVKRAFFDGNNIICDKFIYAHFQKRKMNIEAIDIDKSNAFAILSDRFVDIDPDKIDLDVIKRLNPYKGSLYESFEFWKYQITKPHCRWIKKKLGLDAAGRSDCADGISHAPDR